MCFINDSDYSGLIILLGIDVFIDLKVIIVLCIL